MSNKIQKRLKKVYREPILSYSQTYCPNCYATQFFLAGVLCKEVMVFTDDKNPVTIKNIEKFMQAPKESRSNTKYATIQDVFKYLKPIDKPEDNCLLFTFKHERLEHGAYIVSANPFLAHHRDGICALFEENITNLSQIRRPYSFVDFKYFTIKDFRGLKEWGKQVIADYEPGWWG